MKKKVLDPFPITDVYFLEMNAVDAATVTIGDLCERLSNDFDTGIDAPNVKEVTDHYRKINASKYNSISYHNGADGGYSVYIGVDRKNRIRKIFADATVAEYKSQPKDIQSYISNWWDKEDFNDQFFKKVNQNRIKLFDLDSRSGLIAIGDHAGPLRWLLGWNDGPGDTDSDSELKGKIDLNFFKKKGIFQNTTPILIVNFSYGLITKPQSSSFSSSVIHKKLEAHQEPINYSYTEIFSNLLDESCYPTKYIFNDYLCKVDEFEYDVDRNFNSNFNLMIKKNVKISGKYISDRLPAALQILKKQTKILFKENFKKVFELRRKQFEDFIIGIIKDIEPQELEIPTFGKKNKKRKLSEKKLEISSSEGIDGLFDGYKVKENVDFSISQIIFPVSKGLYPVYLHCYSDESFDNGEGDEFAYVKIVVEGIKGCYLNKNENGKLIVNKINKESLYLSNIANKKLKKAQIDKIDLRDSKSLKAIEKLKNLEELKLTNIEYINDWSSLSKLKKLKHLHLENCIISRKASYSFFVNLYKLPNLEKFTLNPDCWLQPPIGHYPDYDKYNFPKKLYPKRLKDFEIIIPQDLKKKEPELKGNQGYGAKYPNTFDLRVLQVSDLPNFEKIKTLNKLRFYNWYSEIYNEGTFSIMILFDKFITKINKFCKNSNVTDVWVYGYDFKKSSELNNTKFASFAKKLTQGNKIKVNGLSERTLKVIKSE